MQSFVSTYNKTKNMSARAKISSGHGGSAQALHGESGHHRVQSISSAAKMQSADKNHSIQPITEKILDEEHEESGVLDEKKSKDDVVEEDIDDIERSPDIIDLHAVKANDDFLQEGEDGT